MTPQRSETIRDDVNDTAIPAFGKRERKNREWFGANLCEMEPVIEVKQNVFLATFGWSKKVRIPSDHMNVKAIYGRLPTLPVVPVRVAEVSGAEVAEVSDLAQQGNLCQGETTYKTPRTMQLKKLKCLTWLMMIAVISSSICGHIWPNTCTNCFRHDFMYLIQNEDICNETNKDAVDLIILILTRHTGIYNRNVIRSTWASVSRNNTGNVRYVFLLGKDPRHELMENVKLEALYYKDILMEDFRDSYSNLTYKTIMGLKWASSFCDNAKFVMKTDDDMWVNVPQILRLVNRNRLFLQSGVAGKCLRGKPHRRKESKWYITFNEYPLPLYPQYLLGSGYVTSMAVTKQVHNISRNVPFVKFEDVYFGMCVKALGKVDFMCKRAFHYTGEFRKNPCILKSEDVLSCHGVPLPLMQEVIKEEC
ncbi:beta-1,3-galactosyltransferase 5-like [Haliotis asinina]|uniref:beta-1,3-galactosyltransferase 5-like n=1 Tax=Haliotis asinina TaxID=109174 RepID=UPI003531C6CC